MKCNIFRNKIYDYMDDNVSYDMKEAMKNHMLNCESCRNFYENELNIDKQFMDSMKINDITFSSSRAEIMKNIDKKRYGRSINKRLFFHFKRNNAMYLSAAAVLIFAIIFSPYIARQIWNKRNSYSIKKQYNSFKSENIEASDNANNMKAAKSLADSDKVQIASFAVESPKFEKKELNKEEKPQFSTQWKASSDNNLKVCIEGRGENASEEGIGYIYVYEPKTELMWMESIQNGDGKLTPKFVEWWDNENVLVVIGNAYGTVDRGGNLYLLNVKNSNIFPIYQSEDNMKRVLSADKLGNKVRMQILEYQDSNYTLSKNEEIISPADMEDLVRKNAKVSNEPSK